MRDETGHKKGIEDINEVSPESLLGQKIYAATKKDKYVLRGSIFEDGEDNIFVYRYCNGGGGFLIPRGSTLKKIGRNMYYIRS